MFRWGIFGTGPVARKFALGLAASADMRAAIVASRNPENAQRFAAGLGLDAAPSYEQAAGADVDAVYIATPPSEHRRHALLCLEAGKPVLIEKPFAATADDARAIIMAAAERNLFCMEAMWTRFLPLTRALKQAVADGAIGEPRAFAGAFCAADLPDAARNLFNPAMGGGALLHRGVYPLSLACHLLGPVVEIMGTARIGDTGVDEDVSLSLAHESGALSTVRASLRANAPLDAVLSGTQGTIRIDAPIFRPFRMHLARTTPRAGDARAGGRFEALKEGTLLQTAQQRLDVLVRALRGQGGKPVLHAYAGNGYHYQAEEARMRIRAGERESPAMPLIESLHIVEVMETARAQWSRAS
jgi:predicted dehydrogenase